MGEEREERCGGGRKRVEREREHARAGARFVCTCRSRAGEMSRQIEI